MKKLLQIASIIAMVMFAFPASATDCKYGGNWPHCNSAPPSQGDSNAATSSSNSAAGAAAGAVAGAISGSNAGSTSEATGGRSNSSSTSSGGSNTSNDSNKALLLSFPQPVHALNPINNGCVVNKSKAGGFGWNFISGASAVQESDQVCTNLALAVAAYESCQFLTAARIRLTTFEYLNPDQKGVMTIHPREEDLTAKECFELRAHKYTVERIVEVPAAVVVPPAPVKRVVKQKPRKAAVVPNTCETQCKPKT